jgi:hypothetical protein
MKTFFIVLMLSFLGLGDSMKNTDWYSVKFQSLCDELERNVTPERALKYGELKAYSIQQDSVASDTIRVSFDFISNCCEKFESKAELVNETLSISYYKINAETCRCLCDYRFIYSIADTTKRWSRVNVKHVRKKL